MMMMVNKVNLTALLKLELETIFRLLLCQGVKNEVDLLCAGCSYEVSCKF
jgi:hypothetical protein